MPWRLVGATVDRAFSISSRSAIARNILRDVQARYRIFFEVLVNQIAKNGKVDVVFGKALRVLHETELVEPSVICIAAPQAVSPFPDGRGRPDNILGLSGTQISRRRNTANLAWAHRRRDWAAVRRVRIGRAPQEGANRTCGGGFHGP